MSGDLHDLLVRKSARWLIRSRRCTFVLLEPWHAQTEQPDVIGWQHRGWSVLVECKASRTDFLRDRDKCCRRIARDDWTDGLGQERWYAAAQGVIKSTAELPERWGWVELCGTKFRVRRPSWRWGEGEDPDPKILRREFSVLLSALRKAHDGNGDVDWMCFHPKALVETAQ